MMMLQYNARSKANGSPIIKSIHRTRQINENKLKVETD